MTLPNQPEPTPAPREDDVKLAENILKAFMEVPWRGMSKQQIVELVSKQVAIALNPLRLSNEALRKERDCWLFNAKELQSGYNKQDAELKALREQQSNTAQSLENHVQIRQELLDKLTTASEVIEKCEEYLNIEPCFCAELVDSCRPCAKCQALAAIKSWKDKNGKDFTPPVAG